LFALVFFALVFIVNFILRREKAMKRAHPTSNVANYAHQAWLAGLGILGTIQKQGGKLFDELVEEGKKIEARSKQARQHAVSKAETVVAMKEAYQKKLEAQLKEWDAKLDQLTEKAKKMKADTRSKLEDELEGLKAKRAAAQEKLDELRKHGEEAWEDLKGGTEKAWGEISEAFGKVVAHFH
jgi:poly(hydroxyalkanoate) granule-associated protein